MVKSLSIRYQVFINKGVSDKLKEYMEDEFGPGRKPTSSVFKAALVFFLIEKGYWDNKSPASLGVREDAVEITTEVAEEVIENLQGG